MIAFLLIFMYYYSILLFFIIYSYQYLQKFQGEDTRNDGNFL